MTSYRTHLTILQESAALYPDAPAFRVPQLDSKTNQVREWHTVTYRQFHRDVEHVAKYWTRKLSAEGISSRSVVGIWLGGLTYPDVLHIYGIARAGYIPQMFSLRLPNPDIILELLGRSNGKALIYDPSYESALSKSTVSTYVAVDTRAIDVEDVSLPLNEKGRNGDDTIMIFHTSGSTSGCPKLVPCSYAWWDFTIRKAQQVMKPKSSRRRQDVTVWMGSMCHIAQTFMLAGVIQHGSCTVQFTQQAFSSDELVDMIRRCGLTRINQFPTYLSRHIRASRRDPKLLALLQGLDEILISGLMMSAEDEQWVYSNGIKLMNCYGSTEVSSMLLSVEEDVSTLHPLCPMAGTSYAFIPIEPTAQSETGYQDPNSCLLELIILAESPDCPDRSLRHVSGNYHTGDLFLEVAPGKYVFRGRNDDWIKSENSLRCDTKAIEDNVLGTCEDLVASCIVVGNGRPSPALFVEPKTGMDHEKLKKEIVRRTRHFHSRRYMHERITSPNFILVVPHGTLPRTATKGNIRRRAVEDTFKMQLDRVYGATH